MGAIGMIGGLASTGLQIYGMHQQGRATKAAARYNAGLAEAEARNLEVDIRNRETETAEGIKRTRMNQRAYLSEMRARMAAGSGLQLDTGTPLNLMGEAAGRLEISVQDAARASHLQSRSGHMQAASMRAAGQMGIWEAKQAGRANKIGMVGAGIQGLSSAFGQFQQGRHYGNF